MDILLNKEKSKLSSNIDNVIDIDLRVNSKLLPYNSINKTIDSYEVFRNEINGCGDYRLIFTITPICSNVLFNNISEIILREGSDDTFVVPLGKSDDYGPNNINLIGNVPPKSLENFYRLQFIRDTEYSHPEIGPYTYNCGIDIFNNHLFRTNKFLWVGDRIEGEPSFIGDDNEIIGDREYVINDTFNTIRDYSRNSMGIGVKEKYLKDVSYEEIIPHLHQYDTTLTFSESIYNNITSENGWYGFINPSTINISNYNDLTLNKVLNNRKTCEFIDLYPDRSLFSFNPKINTYRNNRVEKNWEYVLTYPYENYYNHPFINGGSDYSKVNAISVIKHSSYVNDSGVVKNKMLSPIKHGLNVGDKINLYYRNSVGRVYTKINTPIEIESIEGNNFIIGNNLIEGIVDNVSDWRFTKNVNGYECEYYFRVFKKLPNLNFTKEYIENGVIISKSVIEKYNKINFNNELNKLGFSENIFGDNLSQIVFTDSIKLNNLVDNRNRPLQEIFLTIVKNNKGYKEWYERKEYVSSDIEYSHAFGKVTSGLDLDVSINDYNIHKLHNINYGDLHGLTIPIWCEPLNDNESGISINNGDFNEDSFYGDIVEYNPISVEEITLEPVYHRVNTAQREYYQNNNGVVDKTYYDIFHDEIIADDYEIDGSTFKVGEFIFNTIINNNVVTHYPANIEPEGYYYNPHYKVEVNKFDDKIQQGFDLNIKYAYISSNDNEIIIKTPINYNEQIDDEITLIERGTKNIDKAYVSRDDGNTLHLIITLKTNNINDIINKLISGMILIYRKNPLIPTYAQYLGDDSGRYLWRNLLDKSEMSDLTFTNNHIYLHNNINFYLHRQDPFGAFGLRDVHKILPTSLAIIDGDEFDSSEYEFINTDNKSDLC